MPTRLRIIEIDRGDDPHGAMAREVRAGLTREPRSIPPKYFYDERGSRLFDAICELPEYYLTRAERALLERYSAEIVSLVDASTLVELGSGMARKTGLLVEALCSRSEAPVYVPFDISRAPLEASAHTLLARHPRLQVSGLVGDFTCDLPRLPAATPANGGPRLFALLGSTIGNLDERAAPAFIGAISRLMTDEDALLLGVDRVKDEGRLHAAYNDAQGVTALFNKNVLRVLSRELGADFDEQSFEHLAFYDAERQRIEMHLVSQRRQLVTLRSLRLGVEFAAGERVLTEISRKFTRASAERMLTRGGMQIRKWLADDDESFSLVVAGKT